MQEYLDSQAASGAEEPTVTARSRARSMCSSAPSSRPTSPVTSSRPPSSMASASDMDVVSLPASSRPPSRASINGELDDFVSGVTSGVEEEELVLPRSVSSFVLLEVVSNIDKLQAYGLYTSSSGAEIRRTDRSKASALGVPTKYTL